MIYTFYSYKGGVGRSMALANVAECFHLQGLRVLMVDWDLEAPGLESFFYEHEADTPSPVTDDASPLAGIALVQSRLGLIDMLTEYKRSFASVLPGRETPGLAIPKAFQRLASEGSGEAAPELGEFALTLDEHLPSISTYLVPIHAATTGAPPGSPGSLSLLPAGWRYKDRFSAYGQAVQAFDWEGFYTSLRGKEYFDWLRTKLLEVADVILIDSRTGVTEMGGVCARQMADVVVSFSAPNNQNIDGVARMVKSFTRPETLSARDGRKLEVVVVPTRVDPSELDDLTTFKSRFERLTDEVQMAPGPFKELGLRFWDLQIPYRAKYSYQERRVIGPNATSADPTKGLENAYWKLSSYLALLAPEAHPVRRQFGSRLQENFPALLPKVVLSYMADGGNEAGELRHELGRLGIKLWPDLLHASDQDDFRGSIQTISQAVHLVVVLSDGAKSDRGIIRREIRFARQEGKAIHVFTPGGARERPFWLQPYEFYKTVSNAFIERLQTTPRTVCAPVLAPGAGALYVERPTEERALRAAVMASADTTGRSTVAVWGPAGCGKTTLTARICQDEDVIDSHPGGIYFVSAADSKAPTRILSAMLRDGAGASSSGDALPAAAALVRGRRCMVVLDDVWTSKDVAPFNVFSDQCTFVVLTRDKERATSGSDTVVEVGMMTTSEANTIFPGDGLVAEQLHRWPLALALARSALQSQGGGERLDDPNDARVAEERLASHGIVAFDRPGTDRNESVARSLEQTLSRLQVWERTRFEQLVALAPSGGVPFALVKEAWRSTPPRIGEPRPLDDQKLADLYQRFAALALVDSAVGENVVRVHVLIRDYFAAKGLIGRSEAGAKKPRERPDDSGKEDVARARAILGGLRGDFDEMLGLVRRLKGARQFSYARRLLSRMREAPHAADRRLYLAQQQALCTYKDPDLPASERAERALLILSSVEDLERTKNQETLGLLGAIFKYKWGADGQRDDLERSATYYLRGYAEGVENDYGYTGINAAFVLDLLASQERIGALQEGTDQGALARRKEARRIREDIATHAPPLGQIPGNERLAKSWWFLATIAEAFFGLEKYEDAQYWLREALATEQSDFDWEFESTARQLGRLALLLNGGLPPLEGSGAHQTLRMFLGNDAAALRSVAVGKVGLALSGGGFRASLFHIGVLAKLAELDLLRDVEVLSCVSGGSIIGAHYYLEVKRLLERKADREVVREDYVEIVQRIERDFVEFVQSNVRTLLLANPWINLKTLFLPNYTRTDRLGELFEKELYAKVARQKKLGMPSLVISPNGAGDAFAPKLDNWQRAAKVPILILNATTLNTGHTWQFTATWMGEPPAGVGTEIDGNDLLRRMYYWEAPRPHGDVSLGRAVAASACVPGLFDPVEFHGLYPNRTVRLVDGGVRDNQGIEGLLEQECQVLLVSDASGQMNSVNQPSAGVLGVPLRSSDILSARVREAQYKDLESRRRSSQLRNFMFIHLKKDLDVAPVDWVGSIDPYEGAEEERRGPLTGYGILKALQERLAGLRTDLDSFNDLEARSLMLSGYRMAGTELSARLRMVARTARSEQWGFLAVEKAVDRARGYEDAHDDVMKALLVGNSRTFKIWSLSAGLKVVGALAVALVGVALYPRLRHATSSDVETWQKLATLSFALLVMVPLVLWVLLRVVRVRKPLVVIATGWLFGSGAWVLARLHLWLLDPGFLGWGRVRVNPFAGANSTIAWIRPLAVLVLMDALVLVPRLLQSRSAGPVPPPLSGVAPGATSAPAPVVPPSASTAPSEPRLADANVETAKALLPRLTSSDAETRHSTRNTLGALCSDDRRVCTLLVDSIQDETAKDSYRVNLGVAVALSSAKSGWIGTATQADKVKKLNLSAASKDPAFRNAVERAMVAYRAAPSDG